MKLARKVWGVDSANPVDQELFDCVKNQFGLPKYWGRYLTEIKNVSSGLTKNEIRFIRSKDIKILPIYNVFSEAFGYEKGQLAARNAVFHARRLGIPTNIVLIANVEQFFQVDSAWIRGWVETLYPTGYRSGFYHDPIKGQFSQAYCQAVQENNEVAVQSYGVLNQRSGLHLRGKRQNIIQQHRLVKRMFGYGNMEGMQKNARFIQI
jgi:hypothetical protein